MSAMPEKVFLMLKKLVPAKFEHLRHAENLISTLQKLKIAVSQIEKLLHVTSEEAKKLKFEVIKLANKLELILDELDTAAQRAPRRTGIGASTCAAKVRGYMDHGFLCSYRLHTRLEKITKKFEDLVKSSSNSVPPKNDVWASNLETIVKSLLGETTKDEPISVLPIVCGVPEIGSTLAQCVLDDERVSKRFEVKCLIRVSKEFDIYKITRRLIEELSSQIHTDISGLASFNDFKDQLSEHLSKKRFFLVLDDVSWIDTEAWASFIRSLSSGASGSRIMVTTRDDVDALFLGTLPASKLELLSNQDCWLLLAKSAFPNEEQNVYGHLESIGKRMVEKFYCHPSAAKVLGRILRDKLEEPEWKEILESQIWGNEGRIKEWLSLFTRYDLLLDNTKLCFEYCSIFPRDYKILKDKLIQLWIAQDLVSTEHGSNTLEKRHEKYFCELSSKSFFKKSNEEEWILGSLEFNFAQMLSGETRHCLKDGGDHGDGADSNGFHENVRHQSCVFDISTKSETLNRFKKWGTLRTLLITSSRANSRVNYLNHGLLPNVFKNLGEVRILCLSGLPIQDLPKSIDKLKELRFLDLSQTQILKLPSIDTLSKLLTLRLNNCIYLNELPNMDKLVKLRHLQISGSGAIKAMPQGMSRLTNLHSLSNFIMREIGGSRIRELKELVHLGGKLTISGLQTVANSAIAREANLSSKTNLDALALEWNSKIGEPRDETVETSVLENLKPYNNLKFLHILCYGGTKFPEWFSSLRSLERASLTNCRKCSRLPLLGQLPLLKDLSIEGMDAVSSIGVQFFAKDSSKTLFPALKTLEFKDMRKWNKWSLDAVDVFPCLQTLKIEKCPELKRFKFHFKVLEKLFINECGGIKELSLDKNFSKLRELEIRQCSKLKELPCSFPSLVKLKIWECKDLTSLSKIPSDGASSEESTSLMDKEFPLLSELDIQSCTKLTKLPHKFPSLDKLSIRKCKELESLSIFPKLRDLILEECDKVMLGNEVDVSSLSSMVICQLPKFEYLGSELIKCLSQLINLEISKCDHLGALSENNILRTQDFKSLKRLVIDGCPKLKHLPDSFSCITSLKELVILQCHDFEFRPEVKLPLKLKRLVIEQCKRLKSLPREIFNSEDIALEFLEIYGCPRLVKFPEGDLPITLKLLSIWDCFDLKCLPSGINRKNTSLNSLRIWNCHSLKIDDEMGLPCNLASLSIMHCENLKPLSDWGLKELKYLRHFSFGGCPNLVNFEKVELHDSLTFLLLKGNVKLKSLSRVLENLNSLDILTIRDCPVLEVLAPGELPSSLSCLYISNCPLLRKKMEGNDWDKIKHIPLIEIDFQSFQKRRTDG